MNKKVSIIIPCYNNEKYVEEAVNSALNQTYRDIEIVIVNDCSTDNSRDVILNIVSQNNNIKFIDNPENKGVIFSRNLAIDNCEGDYILPLDADDTIEPTYVERAVYLLDNIPSIGIVYCKARLFGAKNEKWELPVFNKETIIFGNQIFCSAVFRKSDFYKAGKYKEYMKDGCEDWDLWLSFIELGLDAYCIDEVLFNYRQYKNSKNRSAFCQRKIENVLANLGVNHSALYFTNKILQKKVFHSSIDEVPKLKKKVKKYKKLFNLFLILSGTEIILILLMIFQIWRMNV